MSTYRMYLTSCTQRVCEHRVLHGKNSLVSVNTRTNRVDGNHNCHMSNSFLARRRQKWYVCVLFTEIKLQIFQIIRSWNRSIFVKSCDKSDKQWGINRILKKFYGKICDFCHLFGAAFRMARMHGEYCILRRMIIGNTVHNWIQKKFNKKFGDFISKSWILSWLFWKIRKICENLTHFVESSDKQNEQTCVVLTCNELI